MLETSFHYIIKPVAEMRSAPDDNAEIVSQALFSEHIKIIEQRIQWTHITTTIDNYSGWIRTDSFCTRETPYTNSFPNVIVNRLACHIYKVQDTIYGPLLTLPFESQLMVVKNPDCMPESRWIEIALPNDQTGFIQRGDITLSLDKQRLSDICEFGNRFLGLPYTWGGRSSFGYDCSGFIQMLYRQMGILLPRDSIDQYKWKQLHPVELSSLIPGDLIFFGFGPEKIRHVALHIENGKFIHTCAVIDNAPYVRMNSLNENAWNGSGYYLYSAARRLHTT